MHVNTIQLDTNLPGIYLTMYCSAYYLCMVIHCLGESDFSVRDVPVAN